MALEH